MSKQTESARPNRIGMRIDLAVATVVGGAVLVYLVAGLLTQLFGGVVKWADSPLFLTLTGAIVLVCFGVTFFILRFILTKTSSGTRPAVKPKVLLTILAAVCALAAPLGIFMSYDRVAAHRQLIASQEAARAASIAASQVEAARVAALTPEQRAAEELERQRAAAEAKSKRDAAAKAKQDAEAFALKRRRTNRWHVVPLRL